MPRPLSVRWSAARQAWRSDCGPRNAAGRRRTVFLRTAPDGRPLGPRDQVRALAALAAYVAARDQREAEAAAGQIDPSIEQLVELYLDDRAAHAAPRTYASHRERLEVFLRFTPPDEAPFGDRRARTFDADDLERYRRHLTARGYTPNYVAGLLRSVRACWAWAARPDPNRTPRTILPDNPLAAARTPKTPQPPERYCPPATAAALLDWIDAHFRDAPGDIGRLNRRTALLFRFIHETGCRPDEAARLAWTDLNLETGVATLAHHKTRHVTARPRKIPLSDALRDRLAALQAEPDNHPIHVFTHKRGKGGIARGATRQAGEPWRGKALQHRWRELRQRARNAKLDVPADLTLYDLRRSWQADAIELGFSAEQVAQAAGTSARMVERVYASARERKLQQMAEAIAAARQAAPNQKAPASTPER